MLDGILFLVREPIISVAPPKSMKVPGEVTPAPIIAHMPSIELIMTGVPADKSVCFAAFTVTNPVVRKGEPIVGNQSLGIFISARMLSDQFLVCISTPPVHQASRKSVLASPVSFRLMKSLAPRQRLIFRNTCGSFLRSQSSFVSGRVGKKQSGKPICFLARLEPI